MENFCECYCLNVKYHCEYYSQILPQLALKQETKIDGRGHEYFLGKITWP